ncbi:MAG: hypothetical protein ACOX58_10055 [Christensenellales bacterium]
MLLVITSCIAPPKQGSLLLNNPESRFAQSKKAVDAFVRSGCFSKIVFCDSSDYSFTKEELVDVNNETVEVEVLQFRGDADRVRKQGKGYGEGEIMAYVFEHSRLMKGEPYFFKVTGRLMVRNIMKVIAACKPDTNYFNITSLRSLRAIDTRFYGVSVDAFRMALLDAYRSVNDNAFYYYEMSFRDALKRHRVPFRPFKCFPEICGVSGTRGVEYKTSGIKHTYQRFAARFGFLNTSFSNILLLALEVPNLIARKLSQRRLMPKETKAKCLKNGKE